MTHELAKKLKDAGWVFEGRIEKGVKIEGKWYLPPTLSELIEECEDDFGSLGKYGWCYDTTKYKGKRSLGKWMAIADDKKRTTTYGKSPEEAVANLWIALNDKK